MFRFLSWTCIAAASLAVSACASMPAASVVAQAQAYVARVEPAWQTIKAVALAWKPRLSATDAAKVQSALDIGDQAFADAKAALTLAEAVAAVSRANGAAADITATVAAQ